MKKLILASIFCLALFGASYGQNPLTDPVQPYDPTDDGSAPIGIGIEVPLDGGSITIEPMNDDDAPDDDDGDDTDPDNDDDSDPPSTGFTSASVKRDDE